MPIPTSHTVPTARDFAAPALVAVVALVCMAPAWSAPFVFDDFPAALYNPNAGWPIRWEGLLTEPFWGNRPGAQLHAFFRPLTTLSFALDRLRWDADPLGYHVSNTLFHAAASVLCWAAARRWVSATRALLVGLLFAVLPVHVEAVAAVANRSEILCAIGYLAALIAFDAGLRDRRRAGWAWPVSALLVACAIASKETGYTYPAAAFAWWWWSPSRQDARRGKGGSDEDASGEGASGEGANRAPVLAYFALVLVVVAGMVAWRIAVLPMPFGGSTDAIDNALVAASSASERWLTPAALVGLSVELLAWPARLSADYTQAVWPLETGVPSGHAWLGLLTMAIVGFALVARGGWRRRRSQPGVALGLWLAAATWSVSSQWIVLSTTLFAERLLYLPSAGVILAVVAAVPVPSVQLGRVATAVALLAVVAFGIRSWDRAEDWTSEERLIRTSLQARPGSARLHVRWANLIGQRDPDAALEHLDEALRLAPDHAAAWLNRGVAYLTRGDFPRAEDELEHANALMTGRSGLALYNLCIAQLKQGKFAQGIQSCRRSTELRPDLEAWPLWGDAVRAVEAVGGDVSDQPRPEAIWLAGVERLPQSVELVSRLVGHYHGTQQAEPLAQWLERFIRLVGPVPAACTELGATWRSLGRTDVDGALRRLDCPPATHR